MLVAVSNMLPLPDPEAAGEGIDDACSDEGDAPADEDDDKALRNMESSKAVGLVTNAPGEVVLVATGDI